MARHELIAGPDTVHWGYYDAGLPPLMTIDSGDTLVVGTESGRKEHVEKVGSRASEALRAILEKIPQGPGPHMMTGPVAVRGARPGDALEIRIKDIQPRYDWGYNQFHPLAGGLPADFPYTVKRIVDIDLGRRTCGWGAGVNVPLAPFFGNIGVAPLPAMGQVPSMPPGAWGGNLDNKELVAGTVLYLPVFNEGARLSVGDGHGCQGDGECCLTAVETGLMGTFEVRLRKDLKLKSPRAETPTHHILMGFDPILDNAAKMALRETISFLGELRGMGRDDAYTLCSLAVDLRVTQIVNGYKGVHAMLPKAVVG
ncbi:MAG: acetamidase/formamidase family protein [Candidatus Tectomicrobia bacterium]|uniref:Acetamidase/formamidase family protein n=1 Tax=Tectimicrobiota bacterium TaxID=2528274 RepID=A0A932HXV8_UNCTE|nr:acetamidase/formamidase family protein [Candidatus Tectomicrobia bacterium]